MIGRTISHYEILEQLGEGGMGVVYKAVDTRLDRTVALKFLPARLSKDKSSKDRFVQEAKAASALDDAHICTIFDIGETEPVPGEPGSGELYIVMAYYDGQTLKYLMRDGCLPVEEAVDIAAQMAEGLARAHEAGIVHRDVKPANIMVTDRGIVKILDFGVAKLEGSSVELTQTGSTLGTAAYMSPEQARAEPVDQRADLWALGVVLYEMMTGARPFAGDYEAAVAYAILNEDPVPVSTVVDGVSDELSAVVGRLLAKDPEARFQSALDVVGALDAFRPTRSSSSGSGIAAVAAPPAARSRTMVFAAAAVVLLAVVLLAVGLWSRSGSDEPEGPTVSESTVAVMPFVIRGGDDLQYLGEGLVNLLSTKLDGAGALSTVDPRALIAYVSNNFADGLDPDAARAVAFHFGAKRFIMGDLVAIGEQVEMSAATYDLDEASVTGEVVVSAAQSEILDAIDELSAKLLGKLGLEGEGRVRQLASVTTSSLPALKAYLEGERWIRAGDFPAATVSLEEAVRLDTLFALAYYRLSIANEWGSTGLIYEPARKALSLANRLPDRERQLLTAFFVWRNGRVLEAEDRFRAYLGQYPNDVEALWQLGEALFHGASTKGRSPAESRDLFEKILELEPHNYPAAVHLARLAAADGRTADLEKYHDLVTAASDRFRLEVAAMLAFGTDNTSMQDSIVAELSAAPSTTLMYATQGVGLYSRRPEGAERLARLGVASERGSGMRSYEYSVLAAFAAAQGKFDQSLRLAAEGEEIEPHMMHLSPVLIPFIDWPKELVTTTADRLEALGDSVSPFLLTLLGDELLVVGPAERLYLRAALAARGGDADKARDLVARFKELPTVDQSGSFFRDVPLRIESEIALSEGRPDDALALLEKLTLDSSTNFGQLAFHAFGTADRFTKAELLFAAGRYEDAVRWYDSIAWLNQAETMYLGPSYRRIAQSYDELGETNKAIDYYTRFIDLWAECDPEFQPLVDESRDRLDALLGVTTRESGSTVGQ